MGRKWLVGTCVIVIILVLALIFGAFSSTGLFSLTKETSPVVLGAIFPQSGALAYVGPFMQGGATIAMDEINSTGGINGHKLEFVFEDSQSATAQGVTAYQKLSGIDGIKYYLVSLSGVTLGIAPLAEKEKNLVLNTGSYAQAISSAGDYIFRHNILPNDEVSYLANSICNKFGYKKIALIYANTEAGVSIRDLFSADFSSCGTIVTKEAYDVAGKDFKTQLSKIKLSNPDAIFAITYSSESGLLFNQAKEIGLEKQWFAVSAIESKSFLDVAGNNADGLIYSSFPIRTASPKYIAFREKYLAKYGEEPDMLSSLTYDSTYVFAEAMKHCVDLNDSTCIKNELYKVQNFDGLTGKISFDTNGDTRKEVILKTVRHGKFFPYQAN
ncbi:MAG: ABC transporter substrate-binding protein [archaeon]|jgi:branched-chain amino acid transport system substrate-binding protein